MNKYIKILGLFALLAFTTQESVLANSDDSDSESELYYSPKRIDMKDLYGIRMDDFEEESKRYEMLFNDSPTPPRWAIQVPNARTHEEVKRVLEFKNEQNIYEERESIPTYNIYTKEEGELVGTFSFFLRNQEHEWLETFSYIAEKHRGKGYGKQVVHAIDEQVINPGIGREIIAFADRVEESYLTLQGTTNMIDLDNTPSVAISLSSGRYPILEGYHVYMHNPPPYALEMSMDERNKYKKLSILWKAFKEQKEKNPAAKYGTLEQYRRENPDLKEVRDLKELYGSFLKTTMDPYTFTSSLSFFSYQNELHIEEIKSYISLEEGISKIKQMTEFVKEAGEFTVSPLHEKKEEIVSELNSYLEKLKSFLSEDSGAPSKKRKID